MNAMAIADVVSWPAFDSRGRPTVGCTVTLRGGGQGRAVVPSGASVGGHEAVERRDGGTDFGGYGVIGALTSAREVLRPAVLGLDAADQAQVDAALTATDAHPDLRAVGANAVLAVSLAVLLAAADGAGEPLWRRLGGPQPLLPLPMVNIVSGGAHARGLIDIQDVLVVPIGASSFTQAITWTWRVRAATAELLDGRGGSAALVADEGGLAGALGRNETALALVVDGIARAGLEPGTDVALAVDLAANQLHAGGQYQLTTERRILSASEWLDVLTDWCARYPIVSLEDVLDEDDWAGWAGWAATTLGAGRQLLGDDLFATSAARLQRGIDTGVANAVLVKPNQAGTVSRAAEVVRLARTAGYATVVSARSGDSEDHWLADLAVGWGAGQLKVGSLTRSERTAKWNRLLEIEAGCRSARYAGAAALAVGSRH